MKWDFASVFANTDALLAGAAGTLRIFAICLVLGLGLGLVVGLGRYARARWLYWPAAILLELTLLLFAVAGLRYAPVGKNC